MRKRQWLVLVVIIGTLISALGCRRADETTMEPELPQHPDVLIYTGRTVWIDPTAAETEAHITQNLLQSEGIEVEINVLCASQSQG